MSTAPPPVFLSRVSREFGPLTEELRSLLQSVGEATRTQLSFRQEADTDTTLAKLSLYIHASRAVISLIGKLSGGYPSDASLDDLIHPAPPADCPHTKWRHLLPPGFDKLSYTQWEVILARFWKKPRYLYFRSPDNTDSFNQTTDDDLPHQEAFAKHLAHQQSLDRDSFKDAAELKVLVLRDLWPRKLRRALWITAGLITAAAAAVVLIPRPDVVGVSDQVAGVSDKLDRVSSQIATHNESLADLIKRLDEIKLERAASGQSFRDLTKADLERLLAEKAAITVEELRRRITAGEESPDPLERARALVLKGEFDAALKETSALEESRTHDLIAVLQVKAQAYDGKFQYQDALATRQKIAALTDKEKDLAAWAAAQHMVAYSLTDLGKGREAEPILREVIAVRERVLGPEHSDTLGSRNNLACALRGLGKTVAAAAEHRAVLAVRQRVLGPEHPDTLASRTNLASALGSQGKNAEAAAGHRAVIAVRERVLGPEHPYTLASRSKLAEALRAQGKNAAAAAEHRAVLAVRERVLGPEHLDTFESRTNLAAVLQAQGKNAEAEAEHRAVLAVVERVLGSEHPGTLRIRNNLALSLQGQKKTAEAEAEHRTVLALRERVLGPEHPDTLVSRGNLAGVLQEQGKSAEATAEHSALLALVQRVLGPEHPDIFICHYNMALCLERLGDEQDKAGQKDAARVLWRVGLDHARTVKAAGARVFGKEHPHLERFDSEVADLEAKLKE